ncbi:MAG: hypothetical protein H0W69_01270 [Gemmatimonadaceae bacterium]|nr:hypothetical protein [Gemmatimonadaceae bacterium]MBA3655964.1 hypothetical protein [Gemmatimonadaceae bacterium]
MRNVTSPVAAGVALCFSASALLCLAKGIQLLAIGSVTDGGILFAFGAVCLVAFGLHRFLPETPSERSRRLDAAHALDSVAAERRASIERRAQLFSARNDALRTEVTALIQSGRMDPALSGIMNDPRKQPEEFNTLHRSWIFAVASRTRVFDETLISGLLGVHEGIIGLAGNEHLPERYLRPVIVGLLPSCGKHMGFAHGMGTQAARAAYANVIQRYKLNASHPIARELFAFISGMGSSPAKASTRSFDRRDAICALSKFPDWPAHWQSSVDHFDKRLAKQNDLALRAETPPLDWRGVLFLAWAIPLLLLDLLVQGVVDGLASGRGK